MVNTRKTEIWNSIFKENTHVLNSIIARNGNIYGPKMVNFRGLLQNKEDALEVRRLLEEVFESSKIEHLYAMSAEDGHEIILAIIIPVTAENITDIEVAMTEVCNPFGGENITWEFENDNRTRH